MQEKLHGKEREPLLVSVRTASRRIGFSIETARAEIRSGALPAVVVGKKTFVRTADIQAYVSGLSGVSS